MASKERGTSRIKQRAAQLEAASRITTPAKADTCVVGGGAAGLVAGIVAAEQGAEVVVIEKNLTCGKTILATGNGRCNFANAHLDPHLYNDPHFVSEACGAHWLAGILHFFKQSGLAWVEEAEGRLYPLSRQAASVQSVLLQRAQHAGVILAPAREVTRVSHETKGFFVTLRELWGKEKTRTLHAESVVLATGGTHALTTQNLGLDAIPSSPALCPLACAHPLLPQLDGRRVRARVELVRNQQLVAVEKGEVLFRDYGLSGIAVFNLSRHARPGDTITLDLLPSLTIDEACQLGTTTLDGLLDPVVAQALQTLATSTQEALALAKTFVLRVQGPAEANQAQVHRGGLPTQQFDPHMLECMHVRRLFACGEALDVDGPCGGYNLAWAWKSGMVAGTGAAKEALW